METKNNLRKLSEIKGEMGTRGCLSFPSSQNRSGLSSHPCSLASVISAVAPYCDLALRPESRLQSEVQSSQPQPERIEVLPDYMASSFPQPEQKLPQELFPPPESRESLVSGEK